MRCTSLAAMPLALVVFVTLAPSPASSTPFQARGERSLPPPVSEPEFPRGFDEPIPLHHDGKGLGPFSKPITTNSPEAQLYFDQGIQLLYAFDPNSAARSFREAWKIDPQCAMCYLGEAWAWGPYLNGPMVSADAPRAHAAIRRAMELRDGNTTSVERALIEAMAERYEPEHDSDRRRELDEAWAERANDLYEANPTDLDLGFLAGESLMLLQPRRAWWEVSDPRSSASTACSKASWTKT